MGISAKKILLFVCDRGRVNDPTSVCDFG